MPNPSERQLSVGQLWKLGNAVLSRALRQQGFPNHFPKESPGIEVVTWGQVLERTGETAAPTQWVIGLRLTHLSVVTNTSRLNKKQP